MKKIITISLALFATFSLWAGTPAQKLVDDYKELKGEEIAAYMEYGGYGIIWFDEELEVEKVMFYGATVAEE